MIDQRHVYLAGPMRGYPELNYPAFRDGARRLREAGYEVWSPVEHNEATLGVGDHSKAPIHALLAEDLRVICCVVDGVALLPGWDESAGALAEVAAARAVGKPVVALNDLLKDGDPMPATPAPASAPQRYLDATVIAVPFADIYEITFTSVVWDPADPEGHQFAYGVCQLENLEEETVKQDLIEHVGVDLHWPDGAEIQAHFHVRVVDPNAITDETITDETITDASIVSGDDADG